MANELVATVIIPEGWVGILRQTYLKGFIASPASHYFCSVHELYLRKWQWSGCKYGVPRVSRCE
jgi:hypothetical protein